jgi:AraC-like DNA-binding protein
MIVLGDPSAEDRARFRVLPGFGGTALFDADFRNFIFAPHFHDTLMLGLILEGEKRFTRGRTSNHVAAGGVSIVNPGDIHTGGVAIAGQRLRYSAAYPSAAFLAEAGLPQEANFRPAVVNDPWLCTAFARALSLDTPEGEAEESLLIAVAGLGVRHGEKAQPLPATCPHAVTQGVDYIEANLDSTLRLEDIAAETKVGPRHLIRCFRRSLGVTPQQYVRQARVREVAKLLRRGEGLGQAAVAAGFADQPHMTRAFRTVMGITPASFARSWNVGVRSHRRP